MRYVLNCSLLFVLGFSYLGCQCEPVKIIDKPKLITGDVSSNLLGMKLVYVEGRTIEIGSDKFKESPRRTVTIPSFWIGQKEVSNAEFWQYRSSHRAVAGEIKEVNDVLNQPECPVACVSWEDAQAFCDWLSAREGRKYRLPTEDEWEVCAQAGSPEDFPWGNYWPLKQDKFVENLDHARGDQPDPDGYDGPAPCGNFPANPWGLFDIRGNVGEWNANLYQMYVDKPSEIEQGMQSNYSKEKQRVCRFPSWTSSAFRMWDFESNTGNSEIANRTALPADCRRADVGFRVALDP
ncbi:MAG: formylglycine-generating enzyme family protein [Planctomycetes bacterium]|nr:formylglycine-generating enzyme family protein [Planctomycetota bacterium]